MGLGISSDNQWQRMVEGKAVRCEAQRYQGFVGNRQHSEYHCSWWIKHAIHRQRQSEQSGHRGKVTFRLTSYGAPETAIVVPTLVIKDTNLAWSIIGSSVVEVIVGNCLIQAIYLASVFEHLLPISSAAVSNVNVDKGRLSRDVWDPPVEFSHLSETEREVVQTKLKDKSAFFSQSDDPMILGAWTYSCNSPSHQKTLSLMQSHTCVCPSHCTE